MTSDYPDEEAVEYVLAHPDELTDVPGAGDFIKRHQQFSNDLKEAKAKLDRLTNAKKEFAPLEKAVVECEKELKEADASFSKLYEELGKTTFDAFLAGEIEEQPSFSDRLSLHRKIEELEEEKDSLAPSPDAGMLKKIKAKAQILLVSGKITMKKSDIPFLDGKLGQHIIEEKLNDSVQSATTIGVLRKIAEVGDEVAAASEQVGNARAVLETKRDQLCQSIPLDTLDGFSALESELKSCEQQIDNIEYSLIDACEKVINELAECESLPPLPQELATKIQKLRPSMSRTDEGSGSEGALLIAKGNSGTIELFDNKICIKRKRLRRGLHGDKNIQISSVSAITFKDAGFLDGHLQFSVIGGEGVGKIMRGGIFEEVWDENEVTFDKTQQPMFEKMRDEIENRLEARQNPVAVAPAVAVAPLSDADEIAKLAELRDKNIITEEEFQQKKKQILGL